MSNISGKDTRITTNYFILLPKVLVPESERLQETMLPLKLRGATIQVSMIVQCSMEYSSGYLLLLIY